MMKKFNVTDCTAKKERFSFREKRQSSVKIYRSLISPVIIS